MAHVDVVVNRLISQSGDPYRWGVEVNANDPNPSGLDCSEAIEWAVNGIGIRPPMPDGSWIQARHCRQHRTLIPVVDALGIRGAMLFRFSADPFGGGRPADAHVALSLGDGRSVEARGTAFGVGVFAGARSRRWTHAGLIPGADYGQRKPLVTPNPVKIVDRVLVPGRKVSAATGRLPLWKVYNDGSVHTMNGAPFFGALPHGPGGVGVKVRNVVTLVPYVDVAGTTRGYWLIGADGAVFALGRAPFPGSLPGLQIKPNKPVVGAERVVTPKPARGKKPTVALALIAGDDGTFVLKRG